MAMMDEQDHSHANVRDILAPLFCNGRSFSGLIGDLSRHFKFEALGSGGDAGGGMEASSEGQSTDSDAEVHECACVLGIVFSWEWLFYLSCLSWS